MNIEATPESHLLEEVKAMHLHVAGLHALIAQMSRRMLRADDALVATASFTMRTHAGEAVLAAASAEPFRASEGEPTSLSEWAAECAATRDAIAREAARRTDEGGPMTPRDQIQEHAKAAAAKVQAALEEFEKATGMAAHPVVQWVHHSDFSSNRVSSTLASVRIAYDGEAG